MAKLMLYICIALLVGTVIAGPARRTQTCSAAGNPCASRSDCCDGMICHRYANRCTVEITPEMLQNQRKNLRKTGIRLP